MLASGAASSFALALGALVLPRADAPVAEGDGDALLPGRQMVADAGKDLPELPTTADSDSAEEQDAPKDGADIAFAWFAIAPTPEPVPSPPGVAAAVMAVAIEPEGPAATEAVALPGSTAPLLGEADADVGTPTASVAPEATVESVLARLPTPAFATPKHAEALPIPTGEAPDIAGPKAPKPACPAAETAADAAPLIPSATVARPVAATVPGAQPVPRAEGAALPPAVVELATQLPFVLHEASVRALEAAIPPAKRASEQVRSAPGPSKRAPTMQPLRSPTVAAPLLTPIPLAIEGASAAGTPAASAPLRPATGVESAALAILAPAADAAQPQAAPAPVDVQQAALDTRRQEWVGKMVEHIEALRDAAPVRETRLSLAPEALGKVEVSIRCEGDRVHVHFTTETQAARQLIADAQPRLGELAEARGLKLGQTSFESGTAGQGANRDSREQPAQPQSLKPHPANPESAVGPADDDRIA
ncbi:flagellar hook-length control protein FliK [Sphingomonas psychrotolerans]|uniref:Flagellar hook-length control protein-like C-terminal domain-containing protein n=1 Tax=Sphingomonas psychrotolerans TaxID=1327635 RepID=A0A2K8MGM7_9SPHN|nr:flagellar hook-length control protein FliK [Sphingomonas psychrotolerans]ATY33013.1 hypothetical protein CVN68_14425 [Sphingomonas psychrotolerans]